MRYSGDIENELCIPLRKNILNIKKERNRIFMDYQCSFSNIKIHGILDGLYESE